MSAPAVAWLAAYAGPVPPQLAARMRQAADHEDAGTGIAADLGAAALRCLGAAVPLGEQRAGALPLLAADALITCACEAAAEQGDLAAVWALFAPEHLAARAGLAGE